MALTPATINLGPGDGQLVVSTGTAGPAAMAGHRLTIEATAWEASLTITEDGGADSLMLSVDPRSLVVVEGHGGASPLSEADKSGISSTIQREILGPAPIRFESTKVARGDGDRLSVAGTLELAGARRSLAFDVVYREDERLSAGITLRQTDYGIKPYTVLFGALRVADELTISVDVRLPAA